MSWNRAFATVLALLCLFGIVAMLGGCKTTGGISPSLNLPKAPTYYKACFDKLTPIPAERLTRNDVVLLVAALRRSEKRHSQCGKDLLAWYAAVRQSSGGK